jgi:hypothetical protein
MGDSSVIPIPPPGERRARTARAVQARRRLDAARRGPRAIDANRPGAGGRAWINGREVAASEARYSHLGRVYD